MVCKGKDITKYFPNVDFSEIKNQINGEQITEYVLANAIGVEFFKALMTSAGGQMSIKDNKGKEKIILKIDATNEETVIAINNKDSTKQFNIRTNGNILEINNSNGDIVMLEDNHITTKLSNGNKIELLNNDLNINVSGVANINASAINLN